MRLLLSFGRIAARGKADGTSFLDELSTNITGHNDNAVAEVNPTALGISQMAIIKYLE
jgi:hypothetical protein